MVADPASQLNCTQCGASIPFPDPAAYLSLHLCSSCGSPRELARAPATKDDPFSAFGLKWCFGVDFSVLERRFYEISRGLHPDRFAALGGEARRKSIERMTFLNEAYRMLKDPEKRREWLLNALAGSGAATEATTNSNQPPPALAMGWFELQEMIAESQDGATAAIAEFESQLAQSLLAAQEELSALERDLDRSLESGTEPSHDLLAKLRKQMLAKNYLSSLEKDVTRLKKRLVIA